MHQTVERASWFGRSKVDYAQPNGMSHSIRASHRVELVDHRGDMKFCGVRRDPEPAPNHFVRGSFGERASTSSSREGQYSQIARLARADQR
jgi:hypothetical protein